MKITAKHLRNLIIIILIYFLCLHGIVSHYVFGGPYIEEWVFVNNFADIFISIVFIIWFCIDIAAEGKKSKLWFEFTIPAFWKRREDPLWHLYQQAGEAFANGDDALGNEILDKIEKFKQ